MASGTTEARGAASGGHLRRDVSLIGLLFVSLGSIIGSGWLFGALFAAQIAGPAALLAWIGGGIGVLLLALIHAELGGMYPVAGGSARYPHFSYGSLVGFAIGWITWVGAVTVAPIEVEAALQYAANYFPWLTSTAAGVTVLTGAGILVAAVLMLLFTIVNLFGVKLLARSNNVIMIWKIAIPFLAIVVIMVLAFHPSNFTAKGGFMPFGIQSVLSAISTGGIIFAYQGFEQAIQLGGETRNPQRNIPIAVIGAMLVGVVLYILLEVAFLGALNPQNLSKGWGNISFEGVAGPFAGLATAVGAGWLATLLYIDAAVSPGGTGLIYTGSSSRLSFALARNHYIPSIFGNLSGRGVPVVSVIFSFIVGMIIFLPFPGWQELVGFITSATVMGYATAPLAFGALRRQEPDVERPFRLPGGAILAPLSFIIANLIIYWTGWPTLWKLFIAIALGFVLLVIAQATNSSDRRPTLDWKAASWLWPYLAGMAIISYLGAFDGQEIIPFGWDILVMVIFSLAIYAFAMSVRLHPDEVRRHVADARDEAAVEEELAV
jgi:amino acid transporter